MASRAGQGAAEPACTGEHHRRGRRWLATWNRSCSREGQDDDSVSQRGRASSWRRRQQVTVRTCSVPGLEPAAGSRSLRNGDWADHRKHQGDPVGAATRTIVARRISCDSMIARGHDRVACEYRYLAFMRPPRGLRAPPAAAVAWTLRRIAGCAARRHSAVPNRSARRRRLARRSARTWPPAASSSGHRRA